MNKKERYEYILRHFQKEMPQVTTELDFGSVFQLLVATMLSAQCTDKRVNMVTPELFRHYPDAKTMAQAEADDVLQYISSVSYPNAKAKHLVEMARMVMRCYACRYSRLSCEPSSGTCLGEGKYTAEGRDGAKEEYSRRRACRRPSLALATRSLRVSES